ncbi:MAG: glycosyltransferase [Flavobacteriales bacterium]|jgi:glycosyltransferase involved in cell wall biosynthesis|nr:glycosyltransferase [Flavobacteriales bacterium]
MPDSITKYLQTEDKVYHLSLLIPTWNNLEYIQFCVNAIRKNSTLSIQMIVFANEGTDGTVEWLQDQKDIDFIHSEGNAGICYALNLCRDLVKSDYMVYLNDDMYVLPDWDKIMYEEIQALPSKYFMLSATMIEPRDTGNSCVIVKDFGDDTSNFKEKELLSEYQNLHKTDWNGSTWPPNVVHKDLWDLVGGMSVEFSPGMYSDPDISKKLYDAGVRIFKGIGASKVYHFGSKSTKRLKRNIGRELFLMKWGISANFFMNKILNIGKSYQPLEEKEIKKKDVIINKLKILKILLSSNIRKNG